MRANPWLNYTEPLHRLREFGIHMKEMDLIDESLLSVDQIRSVCAYLFDVTVDSLPHPGADPAGFTKRISVLSGENALTYSLGKKKMMPWIDVSAIQRITGRGRAGSCLIS